MTLLSIAVHLLFLKPLSHSQWELVEINSKCKVETNNYYHE
jgi:hypothetical protein